MKRIAALFLVVGILVSMLVPICASGWGLSNFTKINSYYAGRFSDVSSSAWYAENVASVYEFGLMEGISGSEFSPQGNITEAEALTIAARLHKIYTTGNDDFSEVRDEMWEMEPTILEWTRGDTNSPGYKEFFNSWYSVYAYYLSNCTDESSFPLFPFLGADPSGAPFINANRPISRSLFVFYLAHALPEEALQQINNIENGAIPDVPYESNHEIYQFYRAGILTGNDAVGTFMPDSYISRAETAAIVTRMVMPSLRKAVTLNGTKNNTEKLDVAAAFYTGSNSVDGVGMAVYWRNNTGRTINYINFFTRVYDLNGNVLADEITGATLFNCYGKGPFSPENEDCIYYYSGSYEFQGVKIQQFAWPTYDEEVGRYKYSPIGYDGNVYIQPENEQYRYDKLYFSAFMYNGRAARIEIEKIVIEYADGSQETIYSPSIGVHTSPEEDYRYTIEFQKTITCDMVGHSAEPSCTESVVCDRCGETLEALGHDFEDGYCKRCLEPYRCKVSFVPRGLPITSYYMDYFGTPYSFTISSISVEDVETFVYGGEITAEVRLNVDFYFESEYDVFDYSYVYVDVYIYDNAGRLITSEEFTAGGFGYSTDGETIYISVPGDNEYYVEFSVS